MGQQLTSRQAAELAKRSRSQINRDAAAGRLPVAQQYPGYKGPRMFDRDDVIDAYGLEQPERIAS